METSPMKASEMARGQYVCVAHGGCLHSPHITITANGVWVKTATQFTSAHRDCFERWAARERLEEIRAELQAENISYGELAELQSLVPYIEPDDIELLEAAGVPEHNDDTIAR